MKTRILILAAAVVLGLFAAMGAGRYLDAERDRLVRGNEMVTVLVASQDLPTGMTASEIIDKNYLQQREVPRQFIAAGAISSAAALEGKVVASSVSKDEQITQARFKLPAEVGLASATPDGYLAISLPYDAARGVGGLVKPGDQVAVIGTLEQDDEEPQTKIVISKAKVLALGQAIQRDQLENSGVSTAGNEAPLAAGNAAAEMPATITLALTPEDAEKLVFAQEQGSIWLALFAPSDTSTPKTSGVGYKQVME